MVGSHGSTQQAWCQEQEAERGETKLKVERGCEFHKATSGDILLY